MLRDAVATYCICDEDVKFFGIKDDSQCKMSMSELMTFALLSAAYFQCDYKERDLFPLTLDILDGYLAVAS